MAQLGIGTSNVDSSAMLDVVSNNKGFLPPRITLSALNISAPVTNPATGLLIYNTATSGTDSNAVTPGYYYWSGTMWSSISTKGKAVGDMQYWSGRQWTNIPVGANGSVLTLCNGVPKWGSCSDSIILNSGSGGHAIYVTHNDSDPSWADGNVFTNTNVYRELAIAASTNAGATIISRAYIAFDMSALPANANIISAKLSLYGLPSCNTIPQGNVGANNIMIQRVTDNWNQTTITWNTQPPTTTAGQIELPPTTATFNYNVIGIDVTALVKDMRQQTPTKTGGFCLKLKTESIWRSVVYSSNRNEDVSKRPKLEIIFQ
ncbi:MAG: repeat protein [Flavisolibacter sp.]|nr:repeat protein [Flavisolibacter sp.]